MTLIRVLLLLLSAGVYAEEQPPLRFSLSESWAMPMLRLEDGKPTGGIIYDLQRRLAERVGRRAEQWVLPRRRVQQMLGRGEIDVRCYVNPTWLTEPHYQYIWSVPFMTHRDLLVGRAGETAPRGQLRDERVGVVLGFVYPHLNELFDSGQLQRDDGRTQELVLNKLEAGRYRYAVTNELSLRWFNSTRPANRQLQALDELASEIVACVVRDAPDIPTMALLRALVRMKQDGEFEAILQRYR